MEEQERRNRILADESLSEFDRTCLLYQDCAFCPHGVYVDGYRTERYVCGVK